MVMGAGFLEASVSVMCVQNAALSRQEESLVPDIGQKSLKFMDVAAAVRRLFGSFGGAARRFVDYGGCA